MSASLFAQLVGFIPQPHLIAIGDELNNKIRSMRISSIKAIKFFLDENEGIDPRGMSREMKEKLRTFVGQYFDEMDLVDKRELILGVLQLAPHTPIESVIAEAINASGPGLQKLIQMYGEDVKSESLSKVLAIAKSGLRAVPLERLKKGIMLDWDRYFLWIDPNPLGIF